MSDQYFMVRIFHPAICKKSQVQVVPPKYTEVSVCAVHDYEKTDIGIQGDTSKSVEVTTHFLETIR